MILYRNQYFDGSYGWFPTKFAAKSNANADHREGKLLEIVTPINVPLSKIGLCEFLKNMGSKTNPNLTIERINKEGHYMPSNCRWATYSENLKNRRRYAKCVS